MSRPILNSYEEKLYKILENQRLHSKSEIKKQMNIDGEKLAILVLSLSQKLGDRISYFSRYDNDAVYLGFETLGNPQIIKKAKTRCIRIGYFN